MKRAFEPYVTTKTKGTGLGLAVVKKIADEHGARIRIVNLGAPGEAAATLRRAARAGRKFRYHFPNSPTVRVAATELVATSRAH